MNVPVQWIFCVLLVPLILCDRLEDKMYSTISGSICFRRLNATHTTGCGSTLGGSVGVLHLIESHADFAFLWSKPPAPPYTLLVPPWLFNRENILEVTSRAKENVAGIVLIENGTNIEHFSSELNCPNQYGGLPDQTCDASRPNTTWNPFGTRLLHENFPFPIIYVKDAENVQNLVNCYQKFNAHDINGQHKRRLCSIQIKSFMSAAVNSAVCMRRTKSMNNMNPQRYCDPLQSKNVYATLFPRLPEKVSENLILVGTRIDTTSMFDGVGLGAMDSLVPAVTLMSTAHTLNKLLAAHSNGRYNVMFMLFNGEAYDYIGSQRFVYDLEKGAFPPSSENPIKLSDIKLFIDIGSLDSPNSTTIYQFGKFGLGDKIANMFKTNIQKFGSVFDVQRNTTKNLPPTSAQSFLRDNQSFPAVIFYSDNHKNRFYHSIYDNDKNIEFVYKNTSQDFTTLVDWTKEKVFQPSIQLGIRNISSALAFSLYELVTGGEYTSDLAANPYLIDEMLFCYLQSAKCPLFLAAVKDAAVPILPLPPQRYVSVQNSLSYETVGWTYRVLGFLTGRPDKTANKGNCTVLPLAWFAGFNGKGECLYTTQNLSNAYSPAFSIDDYDWKSGRYSTWTESTWNEINIRIFLKPPVSQEAFTLAIGFGVMLISFVLVFIVNTKSDVLFGESTSSINVLTLPSQC
ncbi:nicastrin [Sitodiplosis mosellana]|uniref:nicastrin n=1 Tax=Sitodiplosis mosellana TaxID=263140 RepID=UPI0024441202|nr:nicastrin [Sitodiplosis mosellana]